MAASTAGALKALIEGAGLNLSAYRDEAPQGAGLPYVVIHEAMATIPDPMEDGTVVTVKETAQVSLWQMWRDSQRAVKETYALAGSLTKALAGARLPAAPALVYAVQVIDVQRLLEPDVEVLDRTDAKTLLGFGLVHHVFTVHVFRQL